jgi:hypothetical protein
MPGSFEKTIFERDTSPLKNSIILQKNEIETGSLVDAKLLNFLRH